MNPKLRKFVLIILFFPLVCAAQREASVWFVGSNTQIKFESDNLEVIDFDLNRGIKASICDDKGELLLYTDGITVWNANNEVLVNGTDLTEGNYQIVGNPIFVPYPEKDGHYFLFYTRAPQPGYNIKDKILVYAEIDCYAENNKGRVIFKNEYLHDFFHDNPVVAGFCDNSYYWLVVDRNDNYGDPSRDRIYFYKIDKDGVHKTPKINGDIDIGHSAYFKFSPNGDKLFFGYGYNQSNNWGNIIADFNFLTGDMYNYRDIRGEPFSAREFSSDGTYFYYFDKDQLIQLNSDYSSVSTIDKTKTSLLTLPPENSTANNSSSLQLAPDGRIYFDYYDPEDQKNKIGRINYPNREGIDCEVELNLYSLDEYIPGFPNFVTSFFRSKEPEYFDEVNPDAGPPIEICSRSTANIGGEEQSPNAYYKWFPENYIANPFLPRTQIEATKIFGERMTKTYTLIASDRNCWINFDSTRVTFIPQPDDIVIDGSWSVCPYVEEVDYWADEKHMNMVWFANGGEIAEIPTRDTVRINWWGTNSNASVNAYYSNEDGCYSDTAIFPVRVNVELVTETPKGQQDLCLAQSDSIAYQIRKTNGSVYNWIAHGGEVVRGQGTNKVLVNWKTEGDHSLTVEETSTTIDTICYGESEPLSVEVINDSLNIELRSVSFNLFNNIDLNISGESLDLSKHQMSIIVSDEFDSFIKEVLTSNTYVRVENALYSEIFQLKVINQCGEEFYSNKQQSIVIRNIGYDENAVQLEWNHNKFWSGDRIEDELWRAFSPNDGWEMLHKFSSASSFDYTNESLELDHYFRIREKNLDTGLESWSNVLHVRFDDEITIPDVFTPNGDGYNDVWEIENIAYHDFQELIVFNRYGQKVYNCRNEFVPWDGRTEYGVKQGTYLYELKIGSGEIRRGQVTILK